MHVTEGTAYAEPDRDGPDDAPHDPRVAHPLRAYALTLVVALCISLAYALGRHGDPSPLAFLQ